MPRPRWLWGGGWYEATALLQADLGQIRQQKARQSFDGSRGDCEQAKSLFLQERCVDVCGGVLATPAARNG